MTSPDQGEPLLSRIGLGCSRIGSFNNPQTLAESKRMIDAAIDLGVTLLDTSNIYGQGDSEKTIGDALARRRDRAFVVTKGGRGFSAKMRLMAWLKPVVRPLLARRGGSGRGGATVVTARRAEALRYDWRPERLIASAEASLRRLRTDRLDGFLLHSPPANVAGDPAVGDALARLKRDGKVRHYGVSCDDLATLAAAMTLDGITMVQLPWDVIEAADEFSGPIAQRGIIVLAREVIRLQPSRSPEEAVRRSAGHPIVTTTLVGTTRLDNLRALVAATKDLTV